jgi:hypothetical protein
MRFSTRLRAAMAAMLALAILLSGLSVFFVPTASAQSTIPDGCFDESMANMFGIPLDRFAVIYDSNDPGNCRKGVELETGNWITVRAPNPEWIVVFENSDPTQNGPDGFDHEVGPIQVYARQAAFFPRPEGTPAPAPAPAPEPASSCPWPTNWSDPDHFTVTADNAEFGDKFNWTYMQVQVAPNTSPSWAVHIVIAPNSSVVRIGPQPHNSSVQGTRWMTCQPEWDRWAEMAPETQERDGIPMPGLIVVYGPESEGAQQLRDLFGYEVIQIFS